MVTIYSNRDLINLHDAHNGSLENSDRIEKILNNLSNNGIFKKCVWDEFYYKFLFETHKDNPLLIYLLDYNISSPSIWSRLFGFIPKGMHRANCNACTTEINTSESIVCQICKTEFDPEKFYIYANSIDKNIPESDTTIITHNTIESVKISIGCVLTMIEDLLQKRTKYGFSIVRPPGHHANSSMSGGFCIVNNVAISANYAKYLGLNKIFIFDWDVHHGNGTEDIFKSDPNVVYASIHTAESYPKTGLYTYDNILNICVEKNIDDDAYYKMFTQHILREFILYQPQLLLISAGFDAIESDPMKIMKLSNTIYNQILIDFMQYNIPIGLVLEGGYDIDSLPNVVNNCINTLAS